MTTVAGVLINAEGQVLLVQRRRPGRSEPVWSVPSTDVRATDTSETAIRHELLSTLGIRVDAFSAETLDVDNDDAGRVRAFLFSTWQGRIVNLDRSVCTAVRWFDPDVLPTRSRVAEAVISAWCDHRSGED